MGNMMEKTENPNASTNYVTFFTRMETDNATELYGRIAEIVRTLENSAGLINVEIKKAGQVSNIRGHN